jgi:hypothetical protein
LEKKFTKDQQRMKKLNKSWDDHYFAMDWASEKKVEDEGLPNCSQVNLEYSNEVSIYDVS